MCYDHHDAEDLCQEALLKLTAPAALERYRADGPLDAYLLSVGVRAMLSARRTRRMREWRELEPVEDAGERAGGAEDPHAGSFEPALREAVMRLPERARLVLLLVSLGDYGYDEVAALLGMPLGTVKSTYSRARASLRSALADRELAPAGSEAT